MSLNLENYIASIPGFPKEGILYRDVTPILSNQEAYKETTHMKELVKELVPTYQIDKSKY